MIGIALAAAVLTGGFLGWLGVVVVLLAVGIGRWLKPIPAVLAGLLVVCAVAGVVRIHGWAWNPRPIHDLASQRVLEAEVVTGPVLSGSGQRFVASIGDRRICVTAPVAPRLVQGDTVRFGGDLTAFDDADPRSQPGMRVRRCDATVWASWMAVEEPGAGINSLADRVRQRLSDAAKRAMPGDRGALMAGLATGDDGSLSWESRDAFYETGTSHITAVSGSNLALIVAAFAFSGSALRIRHRISWRLATVVAIWAFAFVVGMPPPVLRAASLATLSLLALAIGRRPDLVTIGLLIAAVEPLIWPDHFSSLSYQLSSASAIAIVLALHGRTVVDGWGLLQAAALSTIAAQVATLPFLAATVGVSSLWSIPANIAIAPLVLIAFPLAALTSLAGSLAPWLGLVIGQPAGIAASAILWTVQGFAMLPGGRVPSADFPAMVTAGMAILTAVWLVLLSGELMGGIVRVSGGAHATRGWLGWVAVTGIGGVGVGLLAAALAR